MSSLPKEYREYLGLGSEIALSLALPIILGIWIDKKFETSPIFLLVGVFFGLLFFLFLILKISKKLNSPKK